MEQIELKCEHKLAKDGDKLVVYKTRGNEIAFQAISNNGDIVETVVSIANTCQLRNFLNQFLESE